MRTILLTLLLWSTMSVAGKFPIIVDPVVNATPPGAKVTAGYFTMVNETDTQIIITGAYSPTIAKVEIHRSYIQDDVAKMELQESVSVQPGATLEFTHGGYHLMLMELTESIAAGQSVDIILTTSVGDMMIEMPVQKIGMSKGEQDHADSSTSATAHESNHSDGKMDEMDMSKGAHNSNDEQASSK